MLTTQLITAERQKHWDSMRKQLNDYRKGNHGKYPDQGTCKNLHNWVDKQRRRLGPFALLDTHLQGDDVRNQRIAILKKDGFVFDLSPHEQALVNQAVIKYSIIDGLYVDEYSSSKEAARQNNITNNVGVSHWLGAWMDPAKEDKSSSLACQS